MEIMVWNIKWGGQKRQQRIAKVIRDRAPEVVVLTEYQDPGSGELVEALTGAKYLHEPTQPDSGFGGVAIFAKTPITRLEQPIGLEGWEARFLPVRIEEYDLELRGIYGPLKKEKKHEQYWDAALEALRKDNDRKVLVVGDFNTGASLLDAPVNDFYCADKFCKLPCAGYTDLWRHYAGASAKAWSWQGRVHPYRLDHAFGTASIVGRVASCNYSHEERLAGISDHSILYVRLATQGD